jgi:hypothetical protein
MVSNVRQALTRKLGPLPVWAWALIAGIGLYMYRARHAPMTGADAASVDTTAPDQTDASGQQDPVTLDPGQSVYDPNTGQLQGTAPAQQDPLAIDPQSPVTLEPGETAYDPNTGQLVDPGAARKKTAKKKVTKRTPKAKPHHSQHKSVKKPGHGKSKPRTVAKVLKGRLKAIKGKGHGYVPPPKARVRGKATASPSGAARTRVNVRSAPAQRQRPAASHVTQHATQRVVRHPARHKKR